MVTNFLLKKKTNPTPYSPISYFKKEKKSPPLIILPHLNIPNATFKN
jgi:hypothetical protein